MAVVYRAKDLNLERYVAVKILRPDFSKDEGFRKRFHQEAKAAANLSHPNIVTVHDFGLDGERLFIIMEYVPGTNLKSMIREQQVIHTDKALDLLIQAAQGIGYAHRAGLIHCDIKPHNMLVAPDGRLKVTDFGIARALTTILPDEKNAYVWGSPQYLSPEQAEGLPPSPASDVYSLGIVLYEMVTGKLPFFSKDATELTRMHKEVVPISTRNFNPDVPLTLDQIILKVLSKEPTSRYRTADQFGRVLENLRDSYKINNQNIQSTLSLESSSGDQKLKFGVPSSKIETKQSGTFDWKTALLALLAFLLAGGLIPFLLYIWFSLNSGR
ncbi:MAG: serine/threonine protein kinase [Anaerolineaceae bacterium]|nr:serine/threonine protein kinase [Anaerolineaceae bacterium]